MGANCDVDVIWETDGQSCETIIIVSGSAELLDDSPKPNGNPPVLADAELLEDGPVPNGNPPVLAEERWWHCTNPGSP